MRTIADTAAGHRCPAGAAGAGGLRPARHDRPPPRFRRHAVLGLIAVRAVRRPRQPTDGGTPVFDEKHYVPQAWQMLRNGGVEDNPGYELVVHPPLGKQLIAIGEVMFGYDGVGWRFSAALRACCASCSSSGGRRLTRSTLLGGLAGVLLICDGLSHVQSRMGMLDVFSALFVVAAFATLVCDRDDVRARMAASSPKAGSGTHRSGRGWACAGGGWPPGCCSGWAAR